MRYSFGGLIFGGAYTWRGLFSEFYGSWSAVFAMTSGYFDCHFNVRTPSLDKSYRTLNLKLTMDVL